MYQYMRDELTKMADLANLHLDRAVSAFNKIEDPVRLRQAQVRLADKMRGMDPASTGRAAVLRDHLNERANAMGAKQIPAATRARVQASWQRPVAAPPPRSPISTGMATSIEGSLGHGVGSASTLTGAATGAVGNVAAGAAHAGQDAAHAATLVSNPGRAAGMQAGKFLRSGTGRALGMGAAGLGLVGAGALAHHMLSRPQAPQNPAPPVAA